MSACVRASGVSKGSLSRRMEMGKGISQESERASESHGAWNRMVVYYIIFIYFFRRRWGRCVIGTGHQGDEGSVWLSRSRSGSGVGGGGWQGGRG